MLMKNAIKKIIKMSGITVSSMAAAAFTAYVTTKYLVRIALDREEPKAMQKAENLISGSQSSNKFLKELKEAPKKLEEKGISEEDKSIFQEKLKEMKTASGKNQASFDKEFHELLMKASDNMLLITIMGAVMTVYREWIDIVLKRADAQAKQKLQMYHEGIYSGILEKNVEDVNRFIDKHYDLIEELILI